MNKDISFVRLRDNKSFVFKSYWNEILLNYPTKLRIKVYKAVLDYAATGKVPKLKPLAKMAFLFIKDDIDNQMGL